jgi:hypothetical protein
MEAIGFFTKSEIIKKGQYKATELDNQKKQADMLLTAIDDKYSITVLNGVELKGRGVKKYSNGTYAVTERVFDELKKKYNIACDF